MRKKRDKQQPQRPKRLRPQTFQLVAQVLRILIEIFDW